MEKELGTDDNDPESKPDEERAEIAWDEFYSNYSRVKGERNLRQQHGFHGV